MKKLYIASDHAGYNLKFDLTSLILEEFSDYDMFDCGTYSDESVNYPDYAEKVCNNVLNNDGSRGILICGTGLGMSIVANKFKGIRAALCSESFSAKYAVEHNNSNVLVFGARVIGVGMMKDIVRTFLNSKFKNGKHEKRLNLIKEIENKN